MAKLRAIDYMRYFYCPGCQGVHGFSVDQWTFNGDLNKPTVTPSILVTGYVHTDAAGYKYDSREVHCHSYITDGKIQFLSDCQHELAGQTVDLPDY